MEKDLPIHIGGGQVLSTKNSGHFSRKDIEETKKLIKENKKLTAEAEKIINEVIRK